MFLAVIICKIICFNGIVMYLELVGNFILAKMFLKDLANSLKAEIGNSEHRQRPRVC